MLYSDKIRCAFELILGSPVAVGATLTLDLKIFEDASIPVSFSARTDLSFFDENIAIDCFGGCQGPAAGMLPGGRGKLHFGVKNLVVNSAAEVMASFDDQFPTDLVLVNAFPNTSFSVSIPAYTRSFVAGVAVVELSISFASDKIKVASTRFFYYAPPSFADVRFSTTGTSIDVLFDAPTDRAGMTADSVGCAQILSSESIAKLGTGSRCVWKTDESMTIFLGDVQGDVDRGALTWDKVIKPNDILAVRPDALKSRNQVSAASVSTSVVARPLVVVPPPISVKGTDTIDPCSSLEVRVTVLSPRPATISWSCTNDQDFNRYLQTLSAFTLQLSEGTSQMTTFPKEYVIEISVVDFLGVTSAPRIFRVLKKDSAVPQMQFSPPIVETVRSKQVMIKGETVFSACPVEETDISFSWRQLSGPSCCPIPASVFDTNKPQLLLPANLLPPGSVYQLVLRAAMQDVSQSSESVVTVMVGFQPLVAIISGGTQVSELAPVKLSAADSKDPDIDPTAPQGLTYSWECSFLEDGERFSCRDSAGAAIVLPRNQPTADTISIDPGVLPAMESEYIFSVTVQKGSRTSPAASMRVTIVKEVDGTMRRAPAVRVPSIPTVQIALPADSIVVNDAMVVNDDQRLVFEASSSIANTSYVWHMSPGVNLSMPGVTPVGIHSSTFIFAGAFAHLQAGSSYTLELLGRTPSGSLGRSQLAFTVNSAPLGGGFSVCCVGESCLQQVGQAEVECIKTGDAVTQDFRLNAAGWTDPDIPMEYEFGYLVIQEDSSAVEAVVTTTPPPVNRSNSSNATQAEPDGPPRPSEIWFEPVSDSVRDMGFPSGRIRLLCKVRDSLGASTDVLTDNINVSSAEVTVPGSGRRLMSASDFFSKAQAKLAGALKTFRADKINQMANSVASHVDGGGLGPVDASAMKTSLMSSLKSATGKAVKSTGFACESFGAGKTVTGNAGQLSTGSVSAAAGMLMSMVSGGLGTGGLSLGCASSAASMMGSSLKAQAMFARQSGQAITGPLPPQMLSAEEAATFLTSLEGGLKEVMRQANWDAIAGEPTRESSTDASEHSISRTTKAALDGSVLTQKLPALSKITTPATVTLPSTFSAEVFGAESPEIDIHLQAHKGAPSVGTHVVRSPLVGMTVSRARAADETRVQNLRNNLELSIPIDTLGMSLNARMLLAQQAACVHWNKTLGQYSTEGCSVTQVSLVSATCSCNHLTMFAISQDVSIPACGDGILQEGEVCDDNNIYSSDGCSGTCTIEATYTCEGTPSKCTAHILPGKEILNHVGVRSTIGLSGYLSKEDFIVSSIDQPKFVDSVIAALSDFAPSLNRTHVIVINVCYGNDCTTFYSGRRQLSLLTEVDFQINAPSGVNVMSLLKTMASDSFLQSVETRISAAMNRVIGVGYVRAPEEVIETAAAAPALTSQKDPGSVKTASVAGLSAGIDEKPALEFGLLVGIIAGASAFFVLVWMCMTWRWYVGKKRQQTKIRSLVKSIASVENSDSSFWTGDKNAVPRTGLGAFRSLNSVVPISPINQLRASSTQEEAAATTHEDEVVPDAVTPPRSSRLAMHDDLIQEALTPQYLLTPPTNNSAAFSSFDIAMGDTGQLALGNLSLSDLPDEGETPRSRNIRTPEDHSEGRDDPAAQHRRKRFGKARKRLQELQQQLDSILCELPEEEPEGSAPAVSRPTPPPGRNPRPTPPGRNPRPSLRTAARPLAPPAPPTVEEQLAGQDAPNPEASKAEEQTTRSLLLTLKQARESNAKRGLYPASPALGRRSSDEEVGDTPRRKASLSARRTSNSGVEDSGVDQGSRDGQSAQS